MKQDILIFSTQLESMESVYAPLAGHGIVAKAVNDEQTALSELLSHTPAFLWMDLDTEAARSFLSELADRFLRPPPYIILTSSFAGSADRADMLDHGADTCVERPVCINEVISILNAVFRREDRLMFPHSTNLLPCIEYRELLIDPLRGKVTMRGHNIHLTRKEYEVLYLLANHPGVVITRDQIYSRVWKEEDAAGASIVTDCVSSLRRKLGLSSKDTGYIQTVFKVGYRFAESK